MQWGLVLEIPQIRKVRRRVLGIRFAHLATREVDVDHSTVERTDGFEALSNQSEIEQVFRRSSSLFFWGALHQDMSLGVAGRKKNHTSQCMSPHGPPPPRVREEAKAMPGDLSRGWGTAKLVRCKA